jgi:hypothetical protein
MSLPVGRLSRSTVGNLYIGEKLCQALPKSVWIYEGGNGVMPFNHLHDVLVSSGYTDYADIFADLRGTSI